MATETLTIRAIFEDAASSGLTRLEGSLHRVGSKLSALNTEMDTKGSSALTTFKGHLKNTNDLLDTMGHKLDRVIEKVGDKMLEAAKKGIIGIVGLGSALLTMAVNVEKEVQNASLVLSSFMGVSANSPMIQSMVTNMKQSAWLAPVATQAQGMKQLLVNPFYRSQANNLNSAILSIASMSGENSGQTYTQLTNTMGRIEQMGVVQQRAALMLQRAGVSTTDLAAMMGIDVSAGGPAARAFNEVMNKNMTPQQLIQYVQQRAAQTTGWNPTLNGTAGHLSRTEQAYANTIPGAMQYGKVAVQNVVDDALEKMNFGAILNKMIGPVTQLVGSLAQTVVPPTIAFLSSLVNIGNKLIPVVGPLANALGNTLAKGIDMMGKHLPDLTTFGKKFAPAFEKFLQAVIPILPAFLMAVLALMNLLPPFLSMATPFIQILTSILYAFSALINAITRVPGVATVLAGVAAGLLAIGAYAKVVDMIREFAKWWKAIGEADGIMGKLKAGSGSKKGAEAVAKSTVAEMTVDVMYVKGQIGGGGGGGGGGQFPTGGSKYKYNPATGKMEKVAEEDAAKIAERDALGAGEGAAEASILQKLFPTFGKLAGKGGGLLGKVAAKGSGLLSMGGTALKGLGTRIGGGLLGAGETEVTGGALMGGAAWVLGPLAAAAAGALIGHELLNISKGHGLPSTIVRGAISPITMAASGLGRLVFGSGHSTHVDAAQLKASQGQTGLFQAMLSSGVMDPKDAAKFRHDMGHMKNADNLADLYQILQRYENGKGKGVWDQWRSEQALHVHGDINITAPNMTNPQQVKQALHSVATEAERRGGRQPTTPGNQGAYNRINQGRPVA